MTPPGPPGASAGGSTRPSTHVAVVAMAWHRAGAHTGWPVSRWLIATCAILRGGTGGHSTGAAPC